jgi:hypothetical protein
MLARSVAFFHDWRGGACFTLAMFGFHAVMAKNTVLPIEQVIVCCF